ncbi:hypothetical protein [Roseateles chitinivorans]|uniref:hypothetical protein n=1 Tax=Roseateles chitinivorans TaxID=2917965 RepID=UPI003D66B94E
MIQTEPSIHSQALISALKLAKKGAFEEARAAVADIEPESLPTDELRKFALIHSYCGRESEAEQAWESICSRPDVRIGDWFMLGATQADLGRAEPAIGNFQRELAAAIAQKDERYLSAAVIHLAFLLATAGRREEALDVLKHIDDSESIYVQGAGVMSKPDLLAMLG